ncbi:MAG: ATP-binding cassette domain-containing protein [Psychrobium sp.]|nr:ATP-binding cassette domain-containing protein [Psychrobium sp.]
MIVINDVLFALNNKSIAFKKRQVLSNISLKIRRGETVAIIGISGCGKSSLLKVLLEQQREQCSLCPQQPMLVESLSVYHNIYMGQLQQHNFFYNLINLMRPFSKPTAEIRQLTQLIGLESQLFTSVDQLSGGQQQRTSIARALYQGQSIFLGDEPLSSVDPIQAIAMLNIIKARHETVVIALHNKEMALGEFDRIIALSNSSIIFDGPANELNDELMANVYQQPDKSHC